MASETPATQPNDPLNHCRIFAALRDVLADLYPTQQDANIVVHDAGLIAREIAFSPRAKTTWHHILLAALQQQRLDSLLEVVRKDYFSNQTLQIAYAAYQHLIEQGKTLTSLVQLEDTDVMQAISISASKLVTDSTLNSSINVIGRDQNTAGDVVYGDKFGGDKVEGNKTEYHIHIGSAYPNVDRSAVDSSIEDRISTALDDIHKGVKLYPQFPIALVNQKIEEEVNLLRKCRFFAEFDKNNYAFALAQKLVDGELSSGADAIRCQALAWCIRILAPTKELDKAEEYLRVAKILEPTSGAYPELEIANAFIVSYKGDKSAALRTLAGIDLPMSRTAALMVVAHHEGSLGAIAWLNSAGIETLDLDADGKLFLLQRYLELLNWDTALECLASVIDDDFQKAPVLYRTAAIIHLLTTIPNELRTSVLIRPPFEAVAFPLASYMTAVEARRLAHRYFMTSAQIARELNCLGAAAMDDEYALWLELRDPEFSVDGKRRLKAKLNEVKTALRFLHFGLQFGIQLDLDAFEREIERQIALNGGMTSDTATARLALAFTKKSPGDKANYISQHYEQLNEYIDKNYLYYVQIELYSQAGLVDKANECLVILIDEGLSEAEENRLRRRISVAKGADPIETRIAQFRDTDSLSDLIGLVDELENRNEWASLCEYGEILFNQTRSLQDAERLVKALTITQSDE